MGNFLQFLVIFLLVVFVIHLILKHITNPNPQRLMAAAEQGNPEALFQLGQCYIAGKGVEQDDRKAIQYCIRAAQLGHHRAQIVLGLLYKAGQDFVKAGEWLSTAADQEIHLEVPYEGALREFGQYLCESGPKMDAKAVGLFMLFRAGGRFNDSAAQRIAEQVCQESPEILFALSRIQNSEEGIVGFLKELSIEKGGNT